MAPYESILVGTFIYTLGFKAGSSGREPDLQSVSLLAQTPHDHTIGDAIAAWGGRSFVIEFKRNQDAIRSESNKPHRARLLFELRTNAELRELSTNGHFLAFGVVGAACELRFVPYSWAFEVEHDAWRRTCRDLDEFYKLMGSESAGFSPEQLTRYTRELVRLAATAGGANREAIESLIVNLDGNGRVTLVPVDLSRVTELKLGGDVDGLAIRPERTRPPSRGR